MSYGDYSGPIKPNKGHEAGACNVTSCQSEPASHYNHGSHAWYCAGCAVWIGDDVVNKRDWDLRWRPKLGHAMFETREEMEARKTIEKEAGPPAPPRFEDYFPAGYHQIKRRSSSLDRMLKAGRRRA